MSEAASSPRSCRAKSRHIAREPLDFARSERKSGNLRIAGYAALFGIADADGDVIAHGAFARTLTEHRNTPVPLFWQHRPDQPIGAIELVAEDARGLRVIARIDNGAGRAATALQRGEATGLSFGYRARAYRRLPEGRLLEDIELIEVSLVTHPLQHGARVHMAA